MNATETRNHLHAVAISLMDHIDNLVEDLTTKRNNLGPKNWRGVGDLGSLVGDLSNLVSKFSDLTPEQAREVAEEIVAECQAD